MSKWTTIDKVMKKKIYIIGEIYLPKSIFTHLLGMPKYHKFNWYKREFNKWCQ